MFSPAVQIRKVHFQLWGPLLLEVAPATSLMHLAEFGGYNNLPFPIGTRYARIILETHFKQRTPSDETGVEDKSFYLTIYILVALAGKAVSNWKLIKIYILFIKLFYWSLSYRIIS